MTNIIDLSHIIGNGVVTYKGLPAPHVCDFISREASQDIYADGTSFQIEKIELVGNSGTYIDSPFHRYEDGKDLSELDLSNCVSLPGLMVNVPHKMPWQAITHDAFIGLDIAGKAVMINTGWSTLFGTAAYQEGYPFLTKNAAIYLQENGVKLVGIDSHNIDDTRTNTRPVHTHLLCNEVPIVEHLTNLDALPNEGFSFTAAPIKFKGVGSFPTRAYAITNY